MLVGIFTALPLSANARAPIVIDFADDSMLTWNISNNVLTIDGDGILMDKTEDVQPTDTGYWRANRDTITKIIINNTITEIGNYSFYNFPNLVEVDLPSSLTNIGEYAFANCTKLETYTIPDGCTVADTAFEGCLSTPTQPTTIGDNLSWSFNDGTLTISGTGVMNDFTSSQTPLWNEYLSDITNIVIENGVTSIGNYVFKNCPNLTNVTIPNSITSIGNGAFKDCTNLTNVDIPNSVASIGNYAFANTGIASLPNIPENCTLGENAFSGDYFGVCGSKATWTYNISNNTLTISSTGVGTMTNFSSASAVPWNSYRNSITNIVLPSGLTSIGDYAFYNCSKITSINIPNSVASIGNYAFGSCTGLTSMPTIPNGCTVSDTAFKGCLFGICGDNLIWSYDSSTTTLAISGTGTMNNFSSGAAPWNSYKNSITNIVLPNGLATIGNNAFYKCSKITSINIPNSVTSIGNYAFRNCTSLSKPTIPYGCTVADTAFEGCSFNFSADGLSWEYNNGTLTISGSGAMTNYTSSSKAPWYESYSTTITTVIIENGVTSIGSYAFSGCTGLTNVTIPNSVTSIGGSAFNGCTGLTNVTIPNSVTSIGGSVFSNCTGLTSIAIPNGVTSINIETFKNCPNLTNVTIPNSVTSIGNDAFNSCSKITSISIPDNVTSIGVSAFKSCTQLKNISIGNKIDEIHSSSFSRTAYDNQSNYENGALYLGNCLLNIKTNSSSLNVKEGTRTIAGYLYQNSSGEGNIENITIPNGCININNGAFKDCYALTEISLPSTITNIGGFAFERCNNLKSISLGNKITTINDHTFNYCSSLTNVIIPDSVTSIGILAFGCCTSLTSINIPNSVETIGSGAFGGCQSLSGSITIPNNVTLIEGGTFNNCNNVSTIIIPEGVKQCGASAFEDCNNATIVFPSSINLIKNFCCYRVKRILAPVDSYAYNRFTNNRFTQYRTSTTEVVGIISTDQQFASVFQSNDSGKGVVATGSKKGKISTGATSTKASTGDETVEEVLTEEEIAENLSHIRCYLVDDVEIDESVTFDSNNNVVLHLNDFTVNSNGDLVDSTPHTLEGSANGALIEVPGDLTIKTTGEGQGGITNDSGTLFDVKSGGSLTIENGNYSEDVSEYIANNQVIGKNTAGNRYTVLKAHTEDLELENDGHQVVMPNNQDTFEREELVGVQMRAATDNIQEAMRFVSVVRSDILRGGEDYGYVLVKGKSIDNMNARKSDIYAGSDGCTTVSLKGSKNTLANTAYSSANLNEGKYKYLTAAIKDIDDDNTAIGARFYIKRADGTYVYADYTCCATMGMIKAA